MAEENWNATELLSKIDVPLDAIMHMKTVVGEEMFDSFRMYYGDDPDRYNLSFEAIFGTYCNKMEWVKFLSTALATGAHAIMFDDLNKMTTGKMLFYIQVPRVASGTNLPTSRQTTIMVTKYSEKSPITIPFELSAACLTHLKETFEETLLDKLLNIDAINTVLRAVKNTSDAMERGLVNCFLKTLLRKAPPFFITKTLVENSHINKTTINRVQRANMLQSFKSKMTATIFLLNRSRDREYINRFLTQLVDATTESILDNPDTYVTSSGRRLAGVIVSTSNVIQAILNILGKSVSKENVKAPASYGKFVMSKENAVTAIAHHSIMADFGAQAERIASSSQKNLRDASFFDDSTWSFAHIPMDVLTLGEKAVALEHLRRVYKNTDTQDPLERNVHLTFFFPVGLFLPSERGFTTTDNKIKLTDTAQNVLPTCVFFRNKDRVLQRLDFSDALRTLCHPLFNDAASTAHAFAEAGPPTDEALRHILCEREFERCRMGGAARTISFFYQRRVEVPKTVNEIKQDFSITEFYKVNNPTLYTELHPFYDLTHIRENGETVPLCTPRILVGNLPDALAPQEFHEERARQLAEHAKIQPPPDCETTLRALHATLTDTQYPELFYLIDVLVHGNRAAFCAIRELVTRCININFQQRGILAFAHSFDMIQLIVSELSDGQVTPMALAHYRTIMATVRYVQRVTKLNGLNAQLCGEPLLAYVNALFDTRLLPPFINLLPRDDDHQRLVADRNPLQPANISVRNHSVSDVLRIVAFDLNETLFVDNERLSAEEAVLHKIYYLCIVPAMTNNRACGMWINTKILLTEMFYREPFIIGDEAQYAAPVEIEPKLAQMLQNVATDAMIDVGMAARELFLVLPFIGEHGRVLEARAELDPAQRHGRPDFESLQYVMYNGVCAITAPRIIRAYCTPTPFHRFYSDPAICGALNEDIARYLAQFPQYNRNDGSFPIPPAFSHEYHAWHRSPFFRYSASCPNTLRSILTLACMNNKLSPVCTALLSRMGLHPGFAFTAVRTDTFETDSLLYTAKSSTGLVLNKPTVTREDRDISTTYHVTQNINSVDMGFGYSSATVTAYLRRVRTDMGAKVQDLFRVFPMTVFRNDELDAWIRQFVGAERTNLVDTEAIAMLTYGGMSEKNGPCLLHGQRATCELIPTPVTADINYFRMPNNPRGRSSCMLGVDPYDTDAATRTLYDHSEQDPQNFRVTNNPWASQRGSLGDVLYNQDRRGRLGYNSSFYSPCQQFFSTNDIIGANKTLFKTIDEYVSRARDCIRGDGDTQYMCVEGTDAIVEDPCRILQEALPIQLTTTQALLEAAEKTPPGVVHETHFGNYIIAETIPIQRSVLFNNS